MTDDELAKNAAENLNLALNRMLKAGWISSVSNHGGKPVIAWTEKGRDRAHQLKNAFEEFGASGEFSKEELAALMIIVESHAPR